MKLKTIVEATSSLQALTRCNMPVKVAYSIMKLSKIVAEEVKIYHELRNKFINEHGVKSDEGCKIPQEDVEMMKRLFDHVEELGDKEVDIAFNKIKISDLEGVSLPPMVLLNLDWVFEE